MTTHSIVRGCYQIDKIRQHLWRANSKGHHRTTRWNNSVQLWYLQTTSLISLLPTLSLGILNVFPPSNSPAQSTTVNPTWRPYWRSPKNNKVAGKSEQKRLEERYTFNAPIYNTTVWVSHNIGVCESRPGCFGDQIFFSVRYDLRLKRNLYIERTTDGSIPMNKIKAWCVLSKKTRPMKEAMGSRNSMSCDGHFASTSTDL